MHCPPVTPPAPLNSTPGKCRLSDPAVVSALTRPSHRSLAAAPATGVHHPTGSRPWGNYYMDRLEAPTSAPLPRPHHLRTQWFGQLRALDDSVLLDLLGDYLTGPELAQLQRVSRGFYALARHEGLWRQRTIHDFGGAFQFDRTWRQTYRRAALARRAAALSKSSPTSSTGEAALSLVDTQLRLTRFYSDTLFHPWFFGTSDLNYLWKTTRGRPIPRRQGLTLAQFITEFEAPARPVILTDVVTQWPAWGKWTPDWMVERFGDVSFRAEAIDISLRDYMAYSREQLADESPIYLFDKRFGESCPELLEDFQVPEYFNEDLFRVLSDEHPGPTTATASASGRPDYRWIIIGPKRSGSTFHKDPNATSAWNAVITGAKKWIMFPPECLPPGVFTNADQSEVTSPVSLMEWFHTWYSEVKPFQTELPLAGPTRSSTGPLQREGAYEGTCRAGEIIFVPQGWWHCVLNLDESIALTQNYVSRRNLPQVLDFLQHKRDQISGVSCARAPTLYEDFAEAYEKRFPGELEGLRRPGHTHGVASLASDESAEPSSVDPFWQALRDKGEPEFKFGFGFDGLSDESETEAEG
ncbi:hypothetical protein H4R33_001813 [Dimargaris cristalligena]|nr:hypothetical protein H4R33_001813 [Dimargaris cristalligena]